MVRFIQLDENHLEKVLEWRVQEDVTRYMYTDIERDLDQQKQWFARISNSATERYWVIAIKGELAGVISLNGIDLHHQRTSWGFYIGEKKYRMYGGIIPPYLYNYVFFQLGLHKITAEIMAGNESIMKIHRLHGYSNVGIFRDHIHKYGQFHDVHAMELLREQWLRLADKYGKYVSEFE
jgi:UDP-4-amino-4,6-dideoxy-N-acetyl-beta-L-altrosamine N-acetyltransferase